MISTYEKILSSIKDSYDFNFIPVKSTSSKTITLTNTSDSSILFNIN